MDRQLKVILDLDLGPGSKNLIPDLKRQVEDLKRVKDTPAGNSTGSWENRKPSAPLTPLPPIPAPPPPPPPLPPRGAPWTGQTDTYGFAPNPPPAPPPRPGWNGMPLPQGGQVPIPGHAPLGGTPLNTGLMPTWAPVPRPMPLPGPGSAIHGYAPPPPKAAPSNPFAFAPAAAPAPAATPSPFGMKDLAKRFAPLLAASTFVNAASSVGKSANDPFTTAGQAGRSFFRDVVPFGGTIQDATDNISGRTAGYERAGTQSELRRSRTEAEATGTAFGLSHAPAIAGLKERSKQLATAAPIVMGEVDRSTAGGEREFREKSRLLPIQREIAKAEREAAVSTKERQAAEGELYKITAKGNSLVSERANLQEKLKRGDDSGVKRQETLLKIMDNEMAIQSNLSARQAGQGVVFEARQREAQAKGAPAMLRAKLSEAKADNLEERANTASQAALNLGSQGPFERAKGLQAFKFLQETGNPDLLPPSMRSAAMQFGGASAQKIVEKFGANTAEFKEGQRIAPEVYGDPEALRKQAGAARDQAERDKMAGEAAMSAAGAKAGESLGNTVAKVIADMVRAAETKIYTQLKLTKNSQ